MGRSGRSDDDIGQGGGVIALLVMDGRAGKKRGQLLRPFDVTVDNIQPGKTFPQKIAGCQFGHLSGAEEEQCLS